MRSPRSTKLTLRFVELSEHSAKLIGRSVELSEQSAKLMGRSVELKRRSHVIIAKARAIREQLRRGSNGDRYVPDAGNQTACGFQSFAAVLSDLAATR